MPHLHHVDEATDPEEAQKSNHEAPQHHQQQEGEGPRLAPEEQQQPAQATACPVPWNLLLTTINDVPKAETGDGRCRLRDQLGGGDRSTIGPRLRLHKDENNIGAGKLFESHRVPEAQRTAAAQQHMPSSSPRSKDSLRAWKEVFVASPSCLIVLHARKKHFFLSSSSPLFPAQAVVCFSSGWL